MKRKIIKQGHNTLTITLPSQWTKKHGLEAGDEIDLTDKENGIFISTEKIQNGKKISINVEGMSIPTIWKYFMAVYREGYDEVLVRFKENSELDNPYKFLTMHRLDPGYKSKQKIQEALQGFVDRFIGYEIVEQGKDFILIKEMGQLTGKEFDNSLRRVFLLIDQMAEETLEAIKKNNPKVLSHMHNIDINLDKFHDYCVRILNKIGYKESRKTPILFSTLYLLELLGDEFKNISTHLIEDFPKTKKMKNILELAESIKQQIDAFYDLFYKFDKQKIKKMSELDRKTYMAVPEIYNKAGEEEKEIFHHLRMISRYLNALLELRIEMEH